MKNLISMMLLLITLPLFGQQGFRTGDAALEAELRTINIDARKNLPLFKTQVTAEFGIPVLRVNRMLGIMQPAEVILALRISRLRRIPVDRVIQSYQVNKHKGWGAIAKDMGIKPGSAEFHALKGKNKKSTPGNKPSGNNSAKGNGAPKPASPHGNSQGNNNSHGNASGGPTKTNNSPGNSHGQGNSHGGGKSNGKGKH